MKRNYKNLLIYCFCLIVITVFTFTSCSAKKDEKTNYTEQKSENSSKNVEAKLNSEAAIENSLVDIYSSVTFKIKDNPTTGYTWDIKMTGDGKMELVNEWNDITETEADPEKGQLVGAPHFLYQKYKPTKPGKVNFEFRHHQAWEGGNEGYAFYYDYEINDDLTFKLAGDIIGGQVPNERSELEIYTTYESAKK